MPSLHSWRQINVAVADFREEGLSEIVNPVTLARNKEEVSNGAHQDRIRKGGLDLAISGDVIQ